MRHFFFLGDSLDNYGTVLWCGVALWSQVIVASCSRVFFWLRSDLIGICRFFSDFACSESVLRMSVLPYLLMLYTRLSPVTPSLPHPRPLPTSGASSANLSGESDVGARFESDDTVTSSL